jgi:hypothetical protein
MSYVAMGYFGMLPLGSLLVGSISQKITAPLTMLCQGIIALIVAVVFSKFLRKDKPDKRNIERLKEEAITMEKI